MVDYLQVIFFGSGILYFGSTLFIPMLYGLLIAIVLYPVCKWLEGHRWPRSLAITAGLLIVVILFGALISLLVVQANVFWSDVPELTNKLTPAFARIQHWLERTMGISLSTQDEWWRNTVHNFANNAGSIAKSTISATAGTLFILFLVPVFAALFLYNRETFVRFLVSITGSQYRQQLKDVLDEVIHTYSNFIKGMLFVYLIVGALNSIGLLALGIRHAVLFGMLTAFMTIIPYVGIIISALLPISVAWITKDSIWYPVGVVAVFAVVQYLEANVIFPKVVATQLKVSTWITLVAILAGGLLWGVSGMILFIPFVGILKVVLDRAPAGSLNILFEREEKAAIRNSGKLSG
jgi:predicted PurR-regulated permease PerM